jgi:hypothetical protein
MKNKNEVMDRRRDDPNANQVKVLFNLEESDWHNYAAETLWAEPLGDGHYRLKNTPFCAYGYSMNDDVIAAPDKDGRLLVSGTWHRSGHSTYRLIMDKDGLFEEYWKPLGTIGCNYERATALLVAVDIPPKVDIHKAYKFLEDGQQAKAWGFEEAHVGHKVDGK